MNLVAKLRKNEKGLTLIELLAVLVIAGIIAAIAIPTIGNTIKNSKVKADESTIALVQEAAQRYVVDNDITSGATIEFTKDLVNKGYMSKAPTFNSDKFTIKEHITASLDPSGKWSFDFYTDKK